MAKKTTNKCVCHECDVSFDIVVVGAEGKKLVPDICPFCGDVCDLRDERPFLKDFQDYDDFDFDGYYEKEDYDEDEDED